MFAPLLAFILVIPASLAATDWDTPCLHGSCSYETPSSAPGTMTLRLTGSPTAISDLTPAAGWEILDCDQDTLAQDIRAVCVGQNSTCSHLYNNGATDTIVRLPENCGQMPFARIAAEWEHSDQTVPVHVADKLSHRDGEPHSAVRGFTLDTDFHLVDHKQHGEVSMAIQGSILGDDAANRSNARRVGAAFTREDPPSSNPETAPLVFGTNNLLVVNHTYSCSESDGLTPNGLKIHLTSAVHGDTMWSFDVVGSIVPPVVTKFSINNSPTASINGSVTLNSIGNIETTENIQIFENSAGPTLSLPNFLTITPKTSLNLTAAVNLDADLKTEVGFAYNIQNAQYTIPGPFNPSAIWAPGTHSMSLTIDDSIPNTGTIRVDLIPEYIFVVKAFSGAAVVKTDIVTRMDTYTTVDVFLGASPVTGCVTFKSGIVANSIVTDEFYSVFAANSTEEILKGEYTVNESCGAFSGSTKRHARDINKRQLYSCLATMHNQNFQLMAMQPFSPAKFESSTA